MNMPKFTYKAKKTPSELASGTVEADNLDSAIEKIIKLGYVPLDVSAQITEEKPKEKETKGFSFIFSKKIKLADLGIFTRQLFDLIDAGVPLLRALSVITSQTGNPALKDVVNNMYAFVKDGGTLSGAMAQHPSVFSRLYVNMIGAGEAGGNLDEVLNRLAEFVDKDIETRSKVRSSLVYPGLIFSVGCLTIFVLLTFVVPRLTVIFDDLTESLPLPTVILMAVSDIFARFWWALIGFVGLFVFFAKRYLSSRQGKLWFDQLQLKVPVFGNFIKEVEIGRFARTLGTLLNSGVVIVSALDSVWGVVENEVLKQEIKKASQEVASGASLTIALRQCPYFPEVAINMIAVGEESGHLEQALEKLAGSFERQSDRSVKVVTSLIEPLMIVVVGGIVFFIVMAVVLPIFKMNQVIR